MFGFGRRKKPVVAGHGWEQTDFVGDTLQRASQYARDNGIAVGQGFEFTITDVPMGISSPHDIMFGIMLRAYEYDLDVAFMLNEKAHFIRLK